MGDCTWDGELRHIVSEKYSPNFEDLKECENLINNFRLMMCCSHNIFDIQLTFSSCKGRIANIFAIQNLCLTLDFPKTWEVTRPQWMIGSKILMDTKVLACSTIKCYNVKCCRIMHTVSPLHIQIPNHGLKLLLGIWGCKTRVVECQLYTYWKKSTYK